MQNSWSYKSTMALSRLCRSFHLKMTGTSGTDDARVRYSHFKKSQFFYNMKYSTETRSIYTFVCSKMFLTVVNKYKHASNDLILPDPSFLLRYIMKPNTTSS